MIVAMLHEIIGALQDKASNVEDIASGDRLFTRGQKVASVFLLDEGEVTLSRFLPQGRELVLHRARGPTILAEASIYTERYDCDAECLSACRVRNLPVARFLSLIEESAVLSSAWASHLALSLEKARVRREILIFRTVGERLDAWLDWRDGELPPMAAGNEVAMELGVSPETLHRELARRRK
ncbi:Crp/Fnr family transcriptional regulator [Pelagibius sp. Alg239-R121]|uniref:Crp/Fnr family transcriptional regulator n=1 Tax=Pelagibius sp. Alg239-R121 TaxID=2993448 RepID=UPI0024A70365|nr:Crp/Fnr family transcriptional regulator [Pelagibius sp. Alg239-R121]